MNENLTSKKALKLAESIQNRYLALINLSLCDKYTKKELTRKIFRNFYYYEELISKYFINNEITEKECHILSNIINKREQWFIDHLERLEMLDNLVNKEAVYYE